MWQPFQSGATLGTRGSEDGLITRDEEHQAGARITMEDRRPSSPITFAITCGVYGCFFHTCYFTAESEAEQAYTAMKPALDSILALLADPLPESQSAGLTGIAAFVDRFPT